MEENVPIKNNDEAAIKEVSEAYSQFIKIVKKHNITLEPQIKTQSQFHGFTWRAATKEELEARKNAEKDMDIEVKKIKKKIAKSDSKIQKKALKK